MLFSFQATGDFPVTSFLFDFTVVREYILCDFNFLKFVDFALQLSLS